ncbi:MAG: homocysteine methyltransferase [Desulfobacteraceae bacterium]|nr:homocysteine methyltransferase [Desulfobacteraceae bacterium]
MSFLLSSKNKFKITLEVVPPTGHDGRTLLDKLNTISQLGFDGFSVASNPVAKPKMSAMIFCHLLQEQTGKPTILHFTVRDHNRIGLQSELWGAKALGLDTIIAVTGDPSAQNKENPTTTINDLNVFELIQMATKADLYTGAVLDYRPEVDGLANEIIRIEKKVKAGARFIVTQPVYDRKTAQRLHDAIEHIKVPIIMGILPLLSHKHASFLHDKVSGIVVPNALQRKMAISKAPITTGIEQSRQMLQLAKKLFSGACIMPPFDRFDILPEIF